MRTNFLLVSLAAMVVACSDRQPTSPAATTRQSVRPSTDIGAPINGATPAPQAKPVDQVGFTKAVVVYADLILVSAGKAGGGTAWCPAGSVAIGGGYQYYTFFTEPAVRANRPDTSDKTASGWLVGILNTQAGAGDVNVRPYAVCVS